MADFTKNNTTTRTRELLNMIHAKYTDVVVEVAGDYLDGYKVRVLVGEAETCIVVGKQRASANAALLAILYLGVGTITETSADEDLEFYKKEASDMAERIKELQEALHEAKAALANIHKMSKLR
jgi:hypothetical protein